MTKTQQPELPALLPCPFCGAAPYENHIEAHVHVLVPMPPSNGEYVIECACGAGLIDPNRDRVIERWNTRAQAAVLADRESRKVVAWRYMPSPTWGEYVITQDPKVAEVARSMGVEVEELTVGATSKEATR